VDLSSVGDVVQITIKGKQVFLQTTNSDRDRLVQEHPNSGFSYSESEFDWRTPGWKWTVRPAGS